MDRLEKAIGKLSGIDSAVTSGENHDARQLVLITVAYLCLMLSVPVGSLGMLVWFAIYPIAGSAFAGLRFSRVFLGSLVVLPFVALIGVFNPIINRTPAFTVGSMVVTRGWVEYVSIILRTLFSVQATLILVGSVGFPAVCRGLHRLGIPAFLTTQMLMVYRYIKILMGEALNMRRARQARGYGRPALPLRRWGEFVGQLFIRTVDRSERINRAMQARGFRGTIPDYSPFYPSRWTLHDTVVLLSWTALFILMRVFDFSMLFSNHVLSIN